MSGILSANSHTKVTVFEFIVASDILLTSFDSCTTNTRDQHPRALFGIITHMFMNTHFVAFVFSLCAQVTDTGFAQLSASLPEYDAAFFGHVRGGKYGNAVLSLHPIVSRQEVHLRGGSVVTLPAGAKKFLGGVVGAHGSRHRITRGMLVCEIDIGMGGGDERVTVAATHLDHMSRAERLVQLTHVVEELDLHRRPVVLLGDLNTLRRCNSPTLNMICSCVCVCVCVCVC